MNWRGVIRRLEIWASPRFLAPRSTPAPEPPTGTANDNDND